jgi:hypothetical protein
MKLSQVTSTRDLLVALKPQLEVLDADNNSLGSVRRRIDPLVAALPKGVVLSGRTIDSLELDGREVAYLTLRLWLRSHPSALGFGTSADSLAGILDGAAAFAHKGGFSIFPEWLSAASYATAADEKDPIITQLAIGGSSGHGARPDLGSLQFLGLHKMWVRGAELQLAITARIARSDESTPSRVLGADEGLLSASLRFAPPGVHGFSEGAVAKSESKKSGLQKIWHLVGRDRSDPSAAKSLLQWRVFDQNSSQPLGTLGEMPIHLLDAVHRFLAPPSAALGGVLADLRTEANAASSSSSIIRSLCRAIDDERRRRVGVDEAVVQAIIERWKDGEPVVGDVGRGNTNVMAQRV